MARKTTESFQSFQDTHTSYCCGSRFTGTEHRVAMLESIPELPRGSQWCILSVLTHPNASNLIRTDCTLKAPATSAIPYKVEKIDVYEPSAFMGEPSHEVDVAWSNLLRCEY